MREWILRYRWPIAAAAIVALFLAVVRTIAAQPPVPHAVMEGDDCLSCHQAGAAGAPRLAWDHLGRSNEDCARCHEVSGIPAGEIPHPVAGREDCLSCHREGVGETPKLTSNHVDYTNGDCETCHFLSPTAAEPTAVPTPPPGERPAPNGTGDCAACHQLIFADEEHELFTGQPVGDADTGATLFAQLCATCHGEDGTTPVGDEESVINAESYWSTHDDAAILQDIGAGSHGQMTAFAQAYGGPLSWEEILDLAAFVRSWGPVAVEAPPAGDTTYVDTIGPLLTERCGECHGGIAGLTVTDYESLMTGSDAGPVIMPGSPEESRIVEVQRGEHYSQLGEMELDLLIEWIAAGASEQ
ncbi:MAG: c-type cytochrome [Anaerolineae bacterium]|jgi:mono/diheme cytochrome c family protein